jgi:general secretion pathway protein A
MGFLAVTEKLREFAEQGTMYESFFGFKEKPFNITPDPRFLYLSEKHREALSQLVYGVKEKKGFVVLSGGVGTGKTTLIRALLERLDNNCQVAYIFNPKLSVPSFFKYVCQDLGLQVRGRSKVDYLTQLHDFLIDSFNSGKTTTLIVDEAQNLDAPLFEEIRMLTNLETTNQKLLQVFLVGQPELDDLLGQSDRSQLKQRISVRYYLPPLDRKETREYIRTRMSIAGAENLNCFTEDAIQRVFEYSGGIPRLINNICDNALLIGYATEAKIINGKIVQECVGDLKLTSVSKGGIYGEIVGIYREIGDRLRKPLFSYIALGIILVGLLATGLLLFLSGKRTVPRTTTEPKVESENESLITDVSAMSRSKEDMAEESETADTSLTRDVVERKEFRTVVAEKGDTVGQILLRELGRMDLGLLEEVRQLNPEIEDIDRIAVGQEIRIPWDHGEPMTEPQ